MELSFQVTDLSYLDSILRDTHSQEQTQEIRLSDGMPDIGRVVGAWGMAILASYSVNKNEGEKLEDYLDEKVFSGAKSKKFAPKAEDLEGFGKYIENYKTRKNTHIAERQICKLAL